MKEEITTLIVARLHVRKDQVEVVNAFIENTEDGRIVHYSAMISRE